MDPQLSKQVLQLAQNTYQGFNRHHLTEMLAEQEEIHVSRATVDRWLRAAGVPAARKRRPTRAHHRGGTGWRRRGAFCRWMGAGTTGGQRALSDLGGRNRRCHRAGGRGHLPGAGGRPGVLPDAAPGGGEQGGAPGALLGPARDLREDQIAGGFTWQKSAVPRQRGRCVDIWPFHQARASSRVWW